MATAAHSDLDDADPIDSAQLLKHGLAFDDLLDVIGFQCSASDSTAKLERCVEGLSSQYAGLPDLRKRLKKAHDSKTINEPEYRFNLARLVAFSHLEQLEQGADQDGLTEALQDALQAYRKTERLGTSGIDVLASALLMPLEDFAPRCTALGHSTSRLAGEYNLPQGAVALRQEIFHASHDDVGGNDDNDDDGEEQTVEK